LKLGVKLGLMKKLSLYIFLVLMFSNIAQTSDRPLCDAGVDYTNWSNCFGSYESSEGRIYIGEFGDNPGKRDGIGKTELNGSLFLGEFKNDLPKGKGVIIYPDGSITSGEMNGFPNGQIILKISIDNKKKILIGILERLKMVFLMDLELEFFQMEKLSKVFLKKEN